MFQQELEALYWLRRLCTGPHQPKPFVVDALENGIEAAFQL